MFIRIDWGGTGRNYTVHQATKYVVVVADEAGDKSHQILTIDDSREVCLGIDDVAYVMNDNGKTIDTIRLHRRPQAA